MARYDYAIDATWPPLLRDLGVDALEVLRRAGLPEDLLAQPAVRLESEAYYRLWESIERAVGDPLLPIRLGEVVRTESFSPPIFAALCSPNLEVALGRLAHYKPLIAPMRLHLSEIEVDKTLGLSLRLEWLEVTRPPPRSLITTELVFFVCLARLATREALRPLRVRSPEPPEQREAYADYFGVEVQPGAHAEVVFSQADARRPFLTANEGMWQVFEPELRRRLVELDARATAAERVRAVLLEGLPAGQATLDAVGRRLALSPRTLQRRLRAEGTGFQKVLRQTREALARHYLKRSQLSSAEIAFLLGFDEPNSFYRAFGAWTGQTPEGVRQGG